MLGLHRALGLAHQDVAAVALGEHALAAALRRLTQLAPGGEPGAPGRGDGDAGEAVGQRLDVVDDPGVGEQPPGQGERAVRAAHEVGEPARARDGRLVPARPGARAAGDERAPAVAAGAVEQAARSGQVVDDRGAQPPAERGGERELVAGLDLELVGQRRAPARRAGVAAQERVDRGELAADARRLAARPLGRRLGGPAGAAGDLARLVGLGEPGAAGVDRLRQLGHAGGGGVAGLGERR